jgi:hypothetical protein
MIHIDTELATEYKQNLEQVMLERYIGAGIPSSHYAELYSMSPRKAQSLYRGYINDRLFQQLEQAQATKKYNSQNRAKAYSGVNRDSDLLYVAFSRSLCAGMNDKKMTPAELAQTVGCVEYTVKRWQDGLHLPRRKISIEYWEQFL